MWTGDRIVGLACQAGARRTASGPHAVRPRRSVLHLHCEVGPRQRDAPRRPGLVVQAYDDRRRRTSDDSAPLDKRHQESRYRCWESRREFTGTHEFDSRRKPSCNVLVRSTCRRGGGSFKSVTVAELTKSSAEAHPIAGHSAYRIDRRCLGAARHCSAIHDLRLVISRRDNDTDERWRINISGRPTLCSKTIRSRRAI